MKIFGFEFPKKKQIDVSIVRPEESDDPKPIEKIGVLPIKTLAYNQSYQYGRGNFHSAEYDLSEIGKVADVDGFVRQAFKKKEGLMFKEGWGYKGANKETLEYIKVRMNQIAQASDIPEKELIKRIGRALIATSNAFLVKTRAAKASGGKVRKSGNKTLQPVAAYFPAAPETMRAEMDYSTGRVVRWKQLLPSGLYNIYPADDVIHFHIDRREGFLFGIPTIIPVLDDIRALRQIEENIELLLYQHLFPLFHYKVGTETAPAGFTEDGRREVDIVQEQIKMMPSEGALVTPERHEITAIGAEGRGVRAEGYLEHFKKRVFAGLGVSSVDMGDGSTTNRATANTLSRALVDAVKDIQDTIEAQWDHEVIRELLLESTFDYPVLEQKNMVFLRFNEIDLLNKIDTEKHALELFNGNAITLDELRGELNREPFLIPEDPENQDPTQYPEWFTTKWKLFDEPLAMMKVKVGAESAEAQALAGSRGSSITAAELEEEKRQKEEKQKKQEQRAIAAAKANMPQSKDMFIFDSVMDEGYEELKEDFVRLLVIEKNNSRDYLLAVGRAWAVQQHGKLMSVVSKALTDGIISEYSKTGNEALMAAQLARKELSTRISLLLNNLTKQIINTIYSKLDIINNNDIITNETKTLLLDTFEAFKYRIRLITQMEVDKARNYGVVIGKRLTDSNGSVSYRVENGCCEQCQKKSGKTLLLLDISLNDIPPLHPNSRTKLY